jgi:hypothetical protein
MKDIEDKDKRDERMTTNDHSKVYFIFLLFSHHFIPSSSIYLPIPAAMLSNKKITCIARKGRAIVEKEIERSGVWVKLILGLHHIGSVLAPLVPELN